MERQVSSNFHECVKSLSLRSSFTGWGVTVFDSLDTMLLMDLHDEFDHALSLMDQTTFSMDEVGSGL